MGDIIQFLKDKNLYDNTVIIFLSDNGGLSLSPMRSGPSHSQNLPLKAGKGSVYEGGIRIPLLIKQAKQHPANTDATPVIVEDLFPTILSLAKIDNYELVQDKSDGKNLLPLLEGNRSENWNSHPLVWNIPNKWTAPDGPGINFFSAVRQGDYKLLYDMKNGKLELYNLQDDIGELNNLAPKMKGKTKELSKLLSDQLRTWKAQLPTYKATGQQVPYPDQIKLRD